MNIKHIVHGNHHGSNGYIYCSRTSDGYSSTSHLHECYEFVYITEGSCIYTIEGQEYFASPGDIMFTRPGEIHSFSFPEQCVFSRQFLHLYPDYLSEYPELYKNLQEHNDKYYIPAFIAEKYKLYDIFKRYETYYDTNLPETLIISKASAYELMAKMFVILRNEKLDYRMELKNENIKRIMSYINANYKTDLTLADLADHIHLSQVHTSRLFKKEVGLTLTSYINIRRITAAKNLIKCKEKTSSVCFDCGFHDYTTFYRAFVKYTGMSPDKFKQLFVM